MIHLSQICLLVFLATLGVFIYQFEVDADYTLTFLMAGATGCLWLLLRGEHRYTKLTNYRNPSPARPTRVAPQVAINTQIPERKLIPALTPEHQNFQVQKRASIK